MEVSFTGNQTGFFHIMTWEHAEAAAAVPKFQSNIAALFCLPIATLDRISILGATSQSQVVDCTIRILTHCVLYAVWVDFHCLCKGVEGDDGSKTFKDVVRTKR